MKGWGGSMFLDLAPSISISLHFSTLAVPLLSGGVSIFSKVGLCSLHTSTTKGRASCRILHSFVCFHTSETAVSTQMRFVFVAPDLTLFCQWNLMLFVFGQGGGQYFIFIGTWGIIPVWIYANQIRSSVYPFWLRFRFIMDVQWHRDKWWVFSFTAVLS